MTDYILDDPAVLTALGTDPELTDEQIGLLAILLDPANDPSESAETRADVLEEFESFSGTDVDESHQVADRLRTYLNRETDSYDIFEFELIRGTDGVVEQYNVLTGIGDQGLWLTASADAKYLLGYRYGLTGLRAALHIAETLSGDHARLLTQLRAFQPTAANAGTPTDTDIVNAIALGLGTRSEWRGADELEWIADTIGKVRQHPGGQDPIEYRDHIAAAIGHEPGEDAFLSGFISDDAWPSRDADGSEDAG